MKKLSVFILSLFVITLININLYASQENARSQGKIVSFESLDTNNDGNISLQEFQQKVSQMKKNSNFKKRDSQGERTPDRFFNILDKDSNGYISMEEFNNRRLRKNRRE